METMFGATAHKVNSGEVLNASYLQNDVFVVRHRASGTDLTEWLRPSRPPELQPVPHWERLEEDRFGACPYTGLVKGGADGQFVGRFPCDLFLGCAVGCRVGVWPGYWVVFSRERALGALGPWAQFLQRRILGRM